jgi:hypothetical protein
VNPAKSRIYVASSWRNETQPAVVSLLRSFGHDVYDFRNPPGRAGFGWEEIAVDWKSWTPDQYRSALAHPLAIAGYESDIEALKTCDWCLLVLPSGRSASFELGFAVGQGKRCAVLQMDAIEPELMYRECAILTSSDDLVAWARTSHRGSWCREASA